MWSTQTIRFLSDFYIDSQISEIPAHGINLMHSNNLMGISTGLILSSLQIDGKF